jgi:hypothetical protein
LNHIPTYAVFRIILLIVLDLAQRSFMHVGSNCLWRVRTSPSSRDSVPEGKTISLQS